jgi:hypothetical protein
VLEVEPAELRKMTVAPKIASAAVGGTLGRIALRGNRVLINNALLSVVCQPEATDMSQLDPDRFTLRQVDEAREAYAQVMEELELVKEQLARLPTRRDQAFTPLRIMLVTAVTTAALVILWFEAFWRHCL